MKQNQITISEILKNTNRIIQNGNGDAIILIKKYKKLKKEYPELKESLQHAIEILLEIIRLREKIDKKNTSLFTKKNIKMLGFLFSFLILNITLISSTINWWDGEGYFTGNLTVNDLTVVSGESLTLAGAKFSNEGYYTSVDTNWIVQHGKSITSFIGVYAEHPFMFASANLVLQNNQNNSLNIFKTAGNHPYTPNAAAIANENGRFTISVPSDETIAFAHFDNLSTDEYGNLIRFSGIRDILTLNNTHLILAEANVFSVAGGEFKKEGHYMKVNENLLSESEVHGTTFIGAKNTNTTNQNAYSSVNAINANNESLSLIKSSANSSTPSLGRLLNIGGNTEILTQCGNAFVFSHFNNINYDDYGNIINVSGEHETFKVNHTHMDLLDLNLIIGDGLIVNGESTFNGEIHVDDVQLDLTKYVMSSGVLYGGAINKNVSNNSLLDIEEGAGIYVNYSDLNNPIVEYFTWENQTFYPHVNGFRSKWIGFQKNASGDMEVVAQIEFTQEEKRTTVVLGRCINTDGEDTCNIPGKYTTPAFGQFKSVEDLYYALGSISINGNVFSANGANLLLDRSGGYTFRFSAAFASNPQSPNVHYNEPSLGITNYAYHLQNSTQTTKELEIDPDNYDLDGVKTAVPSNRWTIQEMWMFPVSRTTHIVYGQSYYSSQGDAIAAISSEVKEINTEVLEGAIKKGYLIIQQGAIDLSDEDEAAFYEADLDSAGGTYYWERDDEIIRPAEFGDSVELGGNFSVNGTFFVDSNNERVGIGTTTPSHKLDVNGNISANYFMGDGSQLTGINGSGGATDKIISPDTLKNLTLTNTDLVYNDGTIERADFSAVHSKFYSPDGDYILLDDNRFVYEDGTRPRLEINEYVAVLISPSGSKALAVDDTGAFYNGVEIMTINDINPNWDTAYGWGDHDGLYSLLNHKEDTLISPDNDKSLNLTNDFLFYDDSVMNRFLISNTLSYLVSPNGMNYLILNTTGVYANGEIILTTSDKYWTKNGNNLSYDGNLNVSGQLLVEETLTALLSPNGLKHLSVDNSGAFYNGAEILTVSNNPEHDKIISPDTLKNLTLTDSTLIYNDNVNDRILVNSVTSRLVSQGGAYISAGDTSSSINDGTRARVKVDSSHTYLFSPAGTKWVDVSNTGTAITGNAVFNDGVGIGNDGLTITSSDLNPSFNIVGNGDIFKMKQAQGTNGFFISFYDNNNVRKSYLGHGSSSAQEEFSIGNEVVGGDIIFRTAGAGIVVIETDLKVTDLAGSGNDYVCVNSVGQMFRSNTAC